MADSVYKVIELIGTSKESWEKAATAAVSRAGKSLRDLRVAEVVKLDLQLDAKGKVEAYRAKVNVSFKFEGLISESCVGSAKARVAPCASILPSNRKMDGLAYARNAPVRECALHGITAPAARSHRR